MGNVLGINNITDTLYIRNTGTLLDYVYSVTIFQACGENSLIANTSDWSTSSVLDGSKLNVTFTYTGGTNNAPLSISSISSPINIGTIGGLGANVDPENVVVHWTRSQNGPVNIASNVELSSSLLYEFSIRTINTNIVFKSENYVINFDKFCSQEYSPSKTIISSNIQENGYTIVSIGSITVGYGLWYIVANGGFKMSNKKYFFLTDKMPSDYININDFYSYIRDDSEIMSSFGTYQVASQNNICPVNSAMLYTGKGIVNVINWCFTCDDTNASSLIFEEEIISPNTYVDGVPNNLIIYAIKISS